MTFLSMGRFLFGYWKPCAMQEDKFAKKALQLLGTVPQDSTLTDLTTSLTPAPDRNKDKFLFDLVGYALCA